MAVICLIRPMHEGKYKSLDGLRGLAALTVVFWHFFIGFAPFLVGGAVMQHSELGRIISTTPLFLPFAGDFAVIIFFALSGFVLSLSFFKYRTSKVLTSSAARRYFRLMIPALGSVIFAYLVMKLGGQWWHKEASSILSSPWLQTYWNEPGSLITAIYQGIYGVFAFDLYVNSYNTSLWTMHFELIGSFMVFAFLALFGNLRKRWIFYFALGLITMQSYLFPFVLGMALCDLWMNCQDLLRKVSARTTWVLLGVGLLLGSIHESVYPSLYQTGMTLFFTEEQFLVFQHSVGALMVLWAILKLRPVSSFFNLKPLQYLGKISFSLYLIQLPVIYGFSTFVFVHLYYRLGYALSFIVMTAVSLPVIFVLAHYYTRFVDAPSIGWSKTIGAWLLSSKSLRPKKLIEQPDPKPTAKLVPSADTAD